MLRVLEPLCGMAQAIIDPHLLQSRSARKSASRREKGFCLRGGNAAAPKLFSMIFADDWMLSGV